MTPHRAVRLCTRFLYGAVPLAALLLIAWAARLVPDTRPFIFLMLYLTTLLAIVLAAAVAALAQLHIATAEAFAAGYRTARRDLDGDVEVGARHGLHVVE